MLNVVNWRFVSLANLEVQWPIELVSLWLCGLVFYFRINLKALNKLLWLIESFKQEQNKGKEGTKSYPVLYIWVSADDI